MVKVPYTDPTLPESNSKFAPENQWLEDWPPLPFGLENMIGVSIHLPNPLYLLVAFSEGEPGSLQIGGLTHLLIYMSFFGGEGVGRIPHPR